MHDVDAIKVLQLLPFSLPLSRSVQPNERRALIMECVQDTVQRLLKVVEVFKQAHTIRKS